MHALTPFKNLLIGVLCAFSQAAVWAAPVAQSPVLVVRHHFFANPESQELSYAGEVLTLILEKSKAKYGPYQLEGHGSAGWSQNRVYAQLKAGTLDLTASMTDTEREASSIPIRICLYKGLMGVRIGMGTPAVVQALNAMSSRKELDKLRLGQVFDWPDYAIQKAAGLNVLRLTDLSSSIPRLKLGGFDLLPLGVVEVAPLAQEYGLATISTWALAYPTGFYFFVSKDRPELAERLSYGFELALKDKSFDQLFAKRIGPLVAAAELEKRTIFYIPNPALPKATPLLRRELWHPIFQNQLP